MGRFLTGIPAPEGGVAAGFVVWAESRGRKQANAAKTIVRAVIASLF
jgi:hypothetical protein